MSNDLIRGDDFHLRLVHSKMKECGSGLAWSCPSYFWVNPTSSLPRVLTAAGVEHIITAPRLWAFGEKSDLIVLEQKDARPFISNELGYTSPVYAIVVFNATSAEWYSLVFQDSKESLSDYGWATTRHDTNPMTPKWVSEIMAARPDVR